MKKEITIPTTTIEVETKYYATTVSNESMYRNQSPVFDTYEQAMVWIANELVDSTGQSTYRIEAVHGRFE